MKQKSVAAPGAHIRDDNEFSDHIRSACGRAMQPHRLPTTLSAIGDVMGRREKIILLTCEDYAPKVQERLTEQYLATKDDKQ